MEVAAYWEPSMLGRKRAFVTREAFDARTEASIFKSVGNMPDTELLAVRGLLAKAAASAPRVVKHSRRQGFLEAEPRSEEPAAKKIKKASPPPVIKRKKTTDSERQKLKADLEKVASELPHHIMELLVKQGRAISGDEMEIDFNAVEDEAFLEIRKQLDEFLRERADQEQQDANMMAREEEEDVDIVGGVSPLAIVSAPLPLAQEEDEYVDICGDVSPVVFPKNLGDDATISGAPSSSSSCATKPPISELLARAKESRERQARCRAREKARQDVLETEKTAMPSETIHPTVLKSLGIHEYCVGRYSFLRGLGLFLKSDDDQEEQQHRQIFQEELEEGEILDEYGIGKKQHCHRQSFQEELEEGEILG